MKKVLKLENQPIATYNSISFVQSIILAHSNLKNELYNSYINLICRYSDDLKSVGMTFLDVAWEDFRLRGLVNMELYSVSYIREGNIASFIKERIEHDYYVLLYKIDEFYLPYSEFYQKGHYMHDTYIYGYENDDFLVMAFTKNNKLERVSVKQKEIEDGLYSAWLQDQGLGFCSLQVNNFIRKRLNIKQIGDSLYNYLNGKDNKGNNSSDFTAYGLQVYDLIKSFLNNYIILDNKVGLDIRVFRTLWEHKKLMKLRIEKIGEVYDIDNQYHIEAEELERKAQALFFALIKYYKTYDIDIIKRAVLILDDIKEKEKVIIEGIIHIIKQSY